MMESKSPTNWCNLSPKLRTECIKRMDFVSRMLLRATSSTEKSLVELAPKYHFDSVEIDLDAGYGPKVVGLRGAVEELRIEQKTGLKTPEFAEKAQSLVVQLLKYAITDNLEFLLDFETDEEIAAFLSVISSCSSFRFSKLSLSIGNLEIAKAFLQKCEQPGSLELQISTDTYTNAENFELIGIESLARMKRVRLLYLWDSETPYQVIKKWIENDAELGKTLECMIRDKHCMKEIARRLKSRIISKTDTILRLRTNNNSKHILIRSALHARIPTSEAYISVVVIPAKLKNSDYGVAVQWALDVCEHEDSRIAHHRELMFSNMGPQDIMNVMEKFRLDTGVQPDYRDIANAFASVMKTML